MVGDGADGRGKLARDCNDKLEMIGDDKSGLYLFDRDIMTMDNDG